jgi:hypothetical protein
MLYALPQQVRARDHVVVVPMPRRGSRLDRTPLRPDAWGYLRTGRMQGRRSFGPQETERTTTSNGCGAVLILALVALALR